MFSLAEKVYREDLRKWRKNGWALKGLYNSLDGPKWVNEAMDVMKDFEIAWQFSDKKINSSSPLLSGEWDKGWRGYLVFYIPIMGVDHLAIEYLKMKSCIVQSKSCYLLV